ncbi:hypothetical protein E3P92_03601 [Wallemia ichthyophaga]|nr:hypothetical protein E3P96_03845 [Wallemia ichthyophaga]TIB08989.1 hypothetical protein E3P92_03601 [Wallemia ichthyophaga]
MRLLPHEHHKLQLNALGVLAQRRLARGQCLNETESIALISTVIHELIRDGELSVARLMSLGKNMLGRRHVTPDVPFRIKELQVEGTFPDGTFLVTIHRPISTLDGDLALALYSSFCPLPSNDLFPPHPPELYAPDKQPGAIVTKFGTPNVIINKDRLSINLKVTNLGDRPVQVGSHFHFVEVNKQLQFDRGKAYGKRLNILAGTAVRFEPGASIIVALVDIGGTQYISGGSNIATGTYNKEDRHRVLENVRQAGFAHLEEMAPKESLSSGTPFSREIYVSIFGPTTGDRVRLADTDLWIEVERDMTHYGDECKFGGGKVLREGMGQATGRSDCETLDTVVTNALIVDWTGIFKADIGIKNGFIKAIGKAGNPDVMNGVSNDMVVGVNTEVIAGEGNIVVAGAQDVHVHFISPELCRQALGTGITTLVGGGTGGPAAGTTATTCTPGANHMENILAATDGFALNFAITGKGNDSESKGLEDVIEAGAAGLKIHEDWGATPASIDNCLNVADKYDVQVNIHTDTLNESGFVESTIEAFKGRTIHTYHTEGAGGGHAPDIIVVCEQNNVLPSSTNPTRPYCKNTLDEHLDMVMVCHHLDKNVPEDVAFADSRIRGETVAAEDVLHDTGAISMISSDSQAMGRIGEVVSRTWRTAHKMKTLRGHLDGADAQNQNDNERVKRYISKLNINPAMTHGIAHIVGDVQPGKLADLVMYQPQNFGVKPEIVIKGGYIAWAAVGDANASIPTVEPIISYEMFGALHKAASKNSFNFVSDISLKNGKYDSYKLDKRGLAVKKCRDVGKKDMKHNNTTPHMQVDPESYEVRADGILCTVPPSDILPMTKQFNVF